MSGPYQLLDELGRGGGGVVVRARGPDGALVALKLLPGGRAGDAEALARFARETRLQAWLGAAQGFVPLLDHGVGPRGPYLVMPLLPGGTLRDRLRAGPLPVDDAVALVRRVARAMALAHAHGVVHRDLKPENVLFAADGAPLVADLGLARHLAPTDDAASRTGEFRGTLGYAAPEQLDDAARAGPPADVFALGAILHECLAGAPPFGGGGELERIARTRAGKVEPLRRARPDAPPWLAAVVERALAPRPDDRYPHAGALARALARPPRRGRGASSPSSRRRRRRRRAGARRRRRPARGAAERRGAGAAVGGRGPCRPRGRPAARGSARGGLRGARRGRPRRAAAPRRAPRARAPAPGAGRPGRRAP
ncbi:MAG: serine/threonine protein kinase [Planctomycetes bacterium]|nr:serine/threonine protein kinase [Planctomycetota bacterium]